MVPQSWLRLLPFASRKLPNYAVTWMNRMLGGLVASFSLWAGEDGPSIGAHVLVVVALGVVVDAAIGFLCPKLGTACSTSPVGTVGLYSSIVVDGQYKDTSSRPLHLHFFQARRRRIIFGWMARSRNVSCRLATLGTRVVQPGGDDGFFKEGAREGAFPHTTSETIKFPDGLK